MSRIGEPENWFEVYYVSGVDIIPAYLVVVEPARHKSTEVIVRECDGARHVIHRGTNYVDAENWLTEDDFVRVAGREFDFQDFEDIWFEVWYGRGTGANPVPFVIVTPKAGHGAEILILTPSQNRLFEARDYEEALGWLATNELCQVNGREFFVDAIST